VTLRDGTLIEASLLVAADGARSKLRERAGIATHGWDYDQSGIVVTVGHEREHHGRAEEHFLPAGPFAILPLTGKRSSLVWTENRAEAARITALSEDEFHGELEKRFRPAPRRTQAARQTARVSARLFRRALVYRRAAGAGR